MANLQIDKDLRNDVARYILNTYATQKKQTELTDFLSSIAPSYRISCTSFIFQQIVEFNVVLKCFVMSEEEKEALQKKNTSRNDKLTPMDQLVAKMEVVLSNPEDIIIKQGDDAHVFLKETHN